MSAKEIYDRKKRLRAERKLRNEEAALMDDNRDLEGEILLSAAVVALERIADALAALAQKEGE
jgi:hypothetical protein